MEIHAAAAMQVKAMTLSTAREGLEAALAQAQQVPAAAPAADHADVILTLSSAAQSLSA